MSDQVLALQLYYFAFTYITNSDFFTRVNLPETDSNYLLKNAFNYSTNVSALIDTPNYNVLYAPCVVDVRNLRGTTNYFEMILPDEIVNNDRYYICQFVDLFTNNFNYVSSKTNTDFTTKFRIFAPDYTGELGPSDIKAASWFFLILLRVEVNFRETGDLDKAIVFEEGFKLILPNKEYKNTIPLPDTTDINLFDPNLPLKKLYKLYLKIAQWQTSFTNEDLSYMTAFSEIFGVTQNFTPFEWPPDYFAPTSENKSILKTGQSDGITSLTTAISSEGWTTSKDYINVTGPLRYAYKSLIAAFYIYGNNEDEAIYWNGTKDSDGVLLNGINDYTLLVDPIPSTNSPGFWSITAYNLDNQVDPQPGEIYYTAGQGITEPCTITLSNKAPADPSDNRYLRVPPTGYYVILRIYNTDEDSINNFTPNPIYMVTA
jgi:hypothetical protein